MSGEPTIVRAVITGGHDGAAEMVVRLTYGNGVERDLVLDSDTGLDLMTRCGVSHLDDLVGQSWRKFMAWEKSDV